MRVIVCILAIGFASFVHAQPTFPLTYDNDVIPAPVGPPLLTACEPGTECLSRFLPRCGSPRTICLNLHVFQETDGTGNWQNTPADRAALHEIIAMVNTTLAKKNCSPTDPCPGVIYAMKDTQVRVAVKNIYYYRNSLLRIVDNGERLQNEALKAHPGVAGQLNVYLNESEFGPSSVAALPSFFAHDQFIWLPRTWSHGRLAASSNAAALTHAIAHTLGLYHVFGDQVPCDKGACDHLRDVHCNGVCPQDGGWDIDPTLPGNSASNNIMGGTARACFFSDMQIARMHVSLTMTSMRKYVEPCGCVKPPENLGLWLPLDEEGPLALNAAGESGTKVSTYRRSNEIVSNSVCFDGTKSTIDVPSYSAIQPGTGPLSIQAWVRREPPDSGVRTIVDKRSGTDKNVSVFGYALFLHNGRLSLQLGDGKFSNFGMTNEVPADGNYHHVAVTIDRTSAKGGTFYIDGAAVSTFDPRPRAGSLDNPAPLRVGMHASSNVGFRGCIDEVQIVRRVQTAEEIRAVAQAGGVGICKLYTPATPATPLCSGNQRIATGSRICNASTEDREFTYAFSALPVGGNCTVAGPTGFTPQGGVIRVPAGRCVDVPVTVERPMGMLKTGDRACFQTSFTDPLDTVVYATNVVENRGDRCNDTAAPNLPAGLEQTSFCDATLATADWTLSRIGLLGTISGTTPATGGNPGAYRTAKITSPSKVTYTHFLNGDTYAPATDGQISEVSATIDVRLAAPGNGSLSVALVLEQNGAIFIGPKVPVTSTTWKREELKAHVATDFDPIGSGTKATDPDFSCAAKPIRLGYAILREGITGTSPVLAIDNWCVSLKTRCCGSQTGQCCDERIAIDAAGNPILPAGADLPFAEYVDQNNGPVSALYPQLDTSVDTWYPNTCDSSIGGEIPQEADAPDLQQQLSIIDLAEVTPEEIDRVFDEVEALVDAAEPGGNKLAELAPISNGYTPPAKPHEKETYEEEGRVNIPYEYAFDGRDIVFVHGLKFEHLVNKLTPYPVEYFEGANTNWKPVADFTRDASKENPEFYNPTGYYKRIANETWAGHIDRFLTQKNLMNRYLIVSYNCSDRAEVAAAAILRQVADAMKFGTGVVDPLHPGVTPNNFGTPSMVFVTHSTGGLVTDIAFTAAVQHPKLGVSFIPQYTKARVAAHSAFAGSRLATAAVAASYLTHKLPPWLCKATRLILSAAFPDIDLADCPMAKEVVTNSILVDLVPVITQRKWGAAVHDSPVRTLTVGGAHPTYTQVLKYILQPGFDDGVVTVNSQFAIPNTVFMWPSSYAPPFPGGKFRVFDTGVFGPLGGRTLNLGIAKITSTTLNNPLRAVGFFLDQSFDRIYNLPGSAAAPPAVASGPVPWTSPTGMRQPVEWEYPLMGGLIGMNAATGIVDGRNPLLRSPRHYSFILSTADHSRGTTYPPPDANYANTQFAWQPHGEKNWEETRVITDHRVYEEYGNDNAPLLRRAMAPVVEERVRGVRIRYRTLRKWRVTWNEAWIWKRTYYLLQGSESNVQFDYVYESVLR